MRFGGERDEFIRQRFQSLNHTDDKRFLDIEEFSLSEYTKILKCAFIVSVNGLICNDVKIGFNDHGLKFHSKYQFVDSKFRDPHYIMIPFKNKSLAIENHIGNQLLFNGFYRINTKAYNIEDFETPIMESNSVFVDIFNQLFFSQYSQLTTFITYYNFFMDAITYDVCNHYNLPNTLVGLLIYSSNLLMDNCKSPYLMRLVLR